MIWRLSMNKDSTDYKVLWEQLKFYLIGSKNTEVYDMMVSMEIMKGTGSSILQEILKQREKV